MDIQLKEGINIEKEHTDNPKVAKKIALDHLAEIPDYYTRLKKMEGMAFKNMTKKQLQEKAYYIAQKRAEGVEI